MIATLFDLWRGDGGILPEGEDSPAGQECVQAIYLLMKHDLEEVATRVRCMVAAGYFKGLGEGYDAIDFALWLGNLRGSEGGS